MRRRAHARTGQTSSFAVINTTATGAVTANAFTGWTNPVARVTSRTEYGATANTLEFSSMVAPAAFLAKTTASSRDQEFTGWAARCRIFIRLTDAGQAFCLEHNFNGSNPYIAIWYCPTVVETTRSASGGYAGGDTTGWYRFLILANITEIQAAIPSYTTTNTGSHYFTFGTTGVDLFAKYNGVEFFRRKNVFILDAGRVALTATFDGSNGGGFRSATVEHKVPAQIFSDLANRILDVRDFGAKVLQQTGSILAGSNVVSVTDGSQWSVGDPVIVATGGEADFGTGSGGARGGTVGVGGQWPSIVFDTVAKRNAATNISVGRIYGVKETGRTYYFDGTNWQLYGEGFNNYVKYIVPKALLGTVTAVNGNNITLSTIATVTAVNAPVYYNSFTGLNASLFDVNTNPYKASFCTINWPAGRWAYGYSYATGSGTYSARCGNGWTIQGAGPSAAGTVVFSPRGCLNLQFSVILNNGVIQDMRFEGSGVLTEALLGIYTPTTEALTLWTTPLILESSSNTVVRRVHGINGWQAILVLKNCRNSTLEQFYVTHDTGTDRYTQWMVATTDSTNTIIQDGEIDFPQLMCGLETFRSTGSIIRRITGRNFLTSTNGSGEYLFEDMSVRFEYLCEKIGFPVRDQPAIDINSNIPVVPGQSASVGAGGTFRNFDITVEGIMRADGLVWTLFNVSGASDNILIEGKYPTKPVSAPSGSIITLRSEYIDPTFGRQPTRAVACDSNTVNLTVRNIRIQTTETERSPIGTAANVVGTNTTVQNCVVDNLSAGGTQSGNITNAAYEALP